MTKLIGYEGFIKAALIGGILASVLRLVSDRIAGGQWPGYSFTARSISDLVAMGAPTRPLMLAANLIYYVLMLCFATALWFWRPEIPLLRATAVLLASSALFGAVVDVLLPETMDTQLVAHQTALHTVLAAISVFSFLAAIITGGLAQRGWFRIASIAVPAVFITLTVIGVLLGRQGGADTVRTGAQERTMMYTYQVWTVVLAVMLLVRIPAK